MSDSEGKAFIWGEKTANRFMYFNAFVAGILCIPMAKVEEGSSAAQGLAMLILLFLVLASIPYIRYKMGIRPTINPKTRYKDIPTIQLSGSELVEEQQRIRSELAEIKQECEALLDQSKKMRELAVRHYVNSGGDKVAKAGLDEDERAIANYQGRIAYIDEILSKYNAKYQ